jgi:hypothetical protein
MIDERVFIGAIGTVFTFTTGEAIHLTLSCLAGALTCVYMGINIYRKLKEKR